jgi:glutamate carboxypeptidase
MKEELRNQLNGLLPDTLMWLKRLVDLNSFTSNAIGVNRVAEVTAEMFAELGFSAEQVPSEYAAYGHHLFLSRRGSDNGKPVVLVTHSDTVFPPDEEARNDFHWLESPAANRIYGPGTVDNKGGTALIWMLLYGLRAIAPDVFEKTSWLVASNASEEVVASDFGRLTKERCPAGARAVLVFEGGPRVGDEFQIVTARKGRAEFRIQAHGRAAHAGSSHAEGVNAIVALSECVASVASISDYARDLTVNVATIQGGTVLNRVPHEAELALEVRAFEPAMLAHAESEMRRIISEVPRAAPLTLECVGSTAAWPADEATMELFRFWERAASELDLRAMPIKRGGLSDANYLASLGPTLDGLGPAGANAHCSERSAAEGKVPEFVEPGSFVPKAAMNILALLRLLA